MRAAPCSLAAMHLDAITAGYRSGIEGCSALVPVLRDVSLRVPAGQSVLVHGASGAGVTTLLHCAAGLRRPCSGSTSALGVPAWAALRAGLLAFVPRTPRLYDSFTVRDVLVSAAVRVPGVGSVGAEGGPLAAPARAHPDVGCALGLELDAPIARLGAAERWGVAVAGALAAGAWLLVLDVPAEVTVSARARAALRRACALATGRGGGALLGATSAAPPGALLADRRLCLLGGRLRPEGRPASDSVARVAEERVVGASVDPFYGAS